MSNALKEKLRLLRMQNRQINPDPVWVARQKQILMAQIKNTISDEPITPSVLDRMKQGASIFLPERAVMLARPAFVMFVALATTITGWVAGVSASQNSLPGDTLYGVKLAGEKTKVVLAAVAGDKQGEVALHLEFAQRRSAEVKKVVEQTPDAAATIDTAMDNLKKSITSAAESAKEVGDVEKAVVLAQDVSNRTAEINKNLTELAAKVPESAPVTKEVVEAKQVVTAATLDTLKTVVEKTATAETSEMIKVKVAEIVTKKIEKISEEVKTSNEEIKRITDQEAKPAAAPATTTLAVTSTPRSSDSAQSAGVAVSSTPEMAQAVTSLSTAVQKAEQNKDITDKIIADAKLLAGQKNLVGAIEKAKEAAKVTTETIQVLTEARQTADRLIPERTIAPASTTQTIPTVRPIDTTTSPQTVDTKTSSTTQNTSTTPSASSATTR